MINSKAFFSLSLSAVLLITPLVIAGEKLLPTTCKQCTLSIADGNKRYSVSIAEGIEASAWDDIGCAMAWRDNECAMRMSAFDNYAKVLDYQTGEPVFIEKAFFVRGAGMRTPKGYDIVAFKTKQDAESFMKVQQKGDLLTYGQLSDMKWK